MESNLMNVGQLLEKGFSLTMKDNLLRLYDCNQKFIMQYELGINRIFKLNVETTNTQCLCATSVERESKLWHKRLGHWNCISFGAFGFKESGTWNSKDCGTR